MCPGDDNSTARETSGSPTPPPQPITVQDAIEEAPATELRRLMQRVLADLPEARTLIEAALLRPLADGGGGGGESTTGLKRKATEECKNCKKKYQIEDNKKGVCRYHPCKFPMINHRYTPPRVPPAFAYLTLFSPYLAEPEVDTDSTTWDDHDPNVFGEPEDLVDDSTYEDGFVVSCCDKRPYQSGCVVSRHKPKVDSLGHKKVKM